MYRPVLVTAPTITPVTVDQLKDQLDLDADDDDFDTLLSALLAAAVAHLDGWTGILGRCLCDQTWRQDFDTFYRCLPLPLAPVVSITSVTYLDADGASQTVAGSNYRLLNDELGPHVKFYDTFAFPAVRSEGPSVSVTYVAGYGASAGVSLAPDSIKQAIVIAVRHWFDNPGMVAFTPGLARLPLAFDALIAPHRRNRF